MSKTSHPQTKSQMVDPNIRVTKLENGQTHVETVNSEPSLTQQQFKDECDINNIMNKYQKTGEFLHITSKQGQYADFSEIQDYQQMLNTVLEADAAFSSLPALVRKRFENDPGQLISFLQDPNNKAEAAQLGLINQPPPTTTSPPQNNDEPNNEKQLKQKN